MDTHVNLGTIYAEASIEFKAQPQVLQILKKPEAQAASDAVVSE